MITYGNTIALRKWIKLSHVSTHSELLYSKRPLAKIRLCGSNCTEFHIFCLISCHFFCQHIYEHNLFVKNTSFHTSSERGRLWEEWQSRQSQQERREDRIFLNGAVLMCFSERIYIHRVNLLFISDHNYCFLLSFWSENEARLLLPTLNDRWRGC